MASWGNCTCLQIELIIIIIIIIIIMFYSAHVVVYIGFFFFFLNFQISVVFLASFCWLLGYELGS